MNTDTTDLLENARAAIDRLREDIAETERDISYQQMRLTIMETTLALLTGTPATQPRQPRRKRTDAAATPAAAPELGLVAQ
jgi:hypothetical protein